MTRRPDLRHSDQVTPLYHQVQLVLRESIVTGIYRQGELLPTEDKLCGQFRVSKTTVKSALRILAADGLVSRQQGRGTFVTGRQPAGHDKSSVGDLLQNVIAIGETTDVQVIDASYIQPNAQQKEIFGLSGGEKIWRDIHVRSREGEPIGRITAILPPSIAERVKPAGDPDLPMLQKIEQAGVEIARAEQTIGATIADPVLAGQLHIAPGGAVVVVRRLVFDTAGQAVEDLTAHYRGDRYQYRTELHRNPTTGGKSNWGEVGETVGSE